MSLPKQEKQRLKQLEQERQDRLQFGPVSPRTRGQRMLCSALNESDQVWAIGPPGAGKTFLTTVHAADRLRDGDVDRVVLVRPTVGDPDESDMGALPGELEEKMAPWVKPFTDTLKERLGKPLYMQMRHKEEIEIAPLLFMQGCTFKNAIVILDEAQNCTRSQFRMFLTRIGENCQVIILGDPKQSFLPPEKRALTDMVEAIEDFEINAQVIEFDESESVRGPICAEWTEVFDLME